MRSKSSNSLLDGGDSYSLQSMSMEDRSFDDVPLDTRNFRPETKIMLNSGFSVDKTLRNVFNTQMTNVRRKKVFSNNQNSGGSVYEQESIMSNESNSNASLQQLSFASAPFSTESHILPVSTKVINATSTWLAFNQYAISQEEGDIPFDSCKVVIPIHCLEKALRALLPNLTSLFLNKVLHRRYPSDKAMLSYTEFKVLFNILLEYEKGKVIKEKKIMNTIKKEHSNLPSQQSEYSQYKSFVLKKNEIMKQNEDRALDKFNQKPYTHLLEKQRSASSIIYRQLSEDKVLQMPTGSLKLKEIDSECIPSNDLHDSIVDRFKTEARALRAIRMTQYVEVEENNVEGENITNELEIENARLPTPSMKSAPFSPNNNLLDATHSNILTKNEPNFAQPLQKQRVYELANPNYSTTTKWMKMREKRNKMFSTEVKNKVRNNLLVNLQRSFFNEEKIHIKKNLNEQSETMKYYQKARCEDLKREQEEALQRVRERNAETKFRLQAEASMFKDALESSINLSKSTILEDISVRRSLRPSIITKLSIDKSSQVVIPSEITNKIKTATRQKTYDEGKREEKEHYEKVMSMRLFNQKQAKLNSILESNLKGVPVIFTPLNSAQIFNDQLSYSSPTSKISNSNSIHMSPPKSPDDSSLAMEEYLKYKATNAYDYADVDDDDNFSRVSESSYQSTGIPYPNK